MDTNLLVQMVEDITETKTLIKSLVANAEEEKVERKERQEIVDTKFNALETRIATAENTIRDAATSWRVMKYIFSIIIAMLVGIITFNWTAVAANWELLMKAGG